MKQHIWSPTKNQEVQDEHGVSLADISQAIQTGGLRDILATHRPDKYAGQRLFIVELRGEMYVVPTRETETHLVLITAWASRKFRKRYLP
jgi:uncharacterized DUF497 family protein